MATATMLAGRVGARVSNGPLVIGLTVVLVAPCGNALAQGVRIPDSVSCKTCRIQFSQVATLILPDTTKPSPFPDFLSLERDATGQYVFGPDITGARLWLFSPAGRFAQMIGQPGSLAGRYGFISSVRICDGGAFCIVDKAQRRLTVVAQSLRTKTTIQLLSSSDDALMLGDATIVVAGDLPTRESAGLPLHLISAGGGLLRSFGSGVGAFGLEPHLKGMRRLAHHDIHATWSSRVAEYVIELWNTNGQLETTLSREAGWFRSWDGSPMAREDIAPSPAMILGLREEDARLWVTVRLAKSEWRRSDKSSVRAPGGETPAIGVEGLSDYLDTVIEVIDLRSSKVTTRVRKAGLWIPARSANRWFRVRVVDGRTAVDVVEGTLVEQ